jgi:SAM-dependent methyltransferase
MTTRAIPSDAWARGDPYEAYVGRWSRRVAPLFLSWLAAPSARRWLDVGCGTGALLGAIVECCAPAAATGMDPSTGFLETCARRVAGRAELHCGGAERIPLPVGTVDYAVSGLVLNFLPDPSAALQEMARVTIVGGKVAAYVWDYAGRMDLMRHFWDAATELDPRAAALDEGVRFPLCAPQPLASLFERAGMRAVQLTTIDIETRFAGFDDYWRPFLGGQGPAPSYAVSLDQQARHRLRERIRERLPVQTDGSIALKARAWAACGTVAARRRVAVHQTGR